MEVYSPKKAADFLEIGTETLKKYALLLEQNGHTIRRNARNHREYIGTDLALIKAMIILNRDKSVLLEDAASIVTSSDTDIEKIIGEDNERNGMNHATHNTVPTVITLQETAWLEFYKSFVEELKGLKTENQNLQRLIIEKEEKHTQALHEVSSRLEIQEKLIAEQSKAIAEQTATIEDLYRRLDEAAKKKPTLWMRLFSR